MIYLIHAAAAAYLGFGLGFSHHARPGENTFWFLMLALAWPLLICIELGKHTAWKLA